MSLPELARISPETVDAVLGVAMTEADGDGLAKALTALHQMVCLDVLPVGKFPLVVEAARARLLDARTPRSWQAAIDLAVATGDPQLLQMVAGIASGLAQPSFPEQADLRLWARSMARCTLQRYLESRGVPTPDQPDDCRDRGCDDLAG